MTSGHEFRRIRRRRRDHVQVTLPTAEDLLALLSTHVIERFGRLGTAGLIAVPLCLSQAEVTEDPPANPAHPVCAAYACTDYCRESWQLHLAQLKAQPETHWHHCDYERLCAVVPVVHGGRCLAVVRLACTLDTPADEFERQVELLDILVREFVATETDFFTRYPHPAEQAPELSASAAKGSERPGAAQPSHPQLDRARQYVGEQLADPKLTVARVAHEIGVHPNYLSHLFVEQTGQRLSRLIAIERVERAKVLLATAHAPIKDIARAVGFANPNWFSYVFRALTGLTPGGYRQQARGSVRRGRG
jgi:AraC-like DNA-binding protein